MDQNTSSPSCRPLHQGAPAEPASTQPRGDLEGAPAEPASTRPGGALEGAPAEPASTQPRTAGTEAPAEPGSTQRWTARNSAGYEAPAALATDVVVFTVRERRLLALGVAIEGGAWALPGGFVGPDESADASSRRTLVEKTGLGSGLYLEQLATFTAPDRDPRGWIPTVAYVALVPAPTEPTDARARWLPATQPPRLAYDHADILCTAIDRVQGKLWWANVAVGILPGEFTMAQAREVYEAIAGARYDPSTFARDLRATGLIERTGAQRGATGGRPAALYRFRAHSPAWGRGRRKRVR